MGSGCTLDQRLRLSAPGGSGTAHWGRRISCRLLHVSVAYIFIVWVAYTLRKPLSDRLMDSDQAVVLTMLESATTELQKQLHTEDLSSSLNEGLGSESTPDNLTVETPPSPANQMPAVQEAPDRENRSTDEPEDDSYITQSEPKVLEVRYNVVDIEDVIPLPGPAKKPILVADEAKDVEPTSDEEKPPADGEKTPTPDEIPSFSEWAQKKMEEAEKKVLNNTSTGGPSPPRPASSSKLRSKNYASPDCGAKIVASNPEAESANSVLSPSRDEYVLNACVNRIWLVVELCEAIQAKKIDIANFELFSSSPKDFSVSVSDRFPSRDWRSVGQFTAKDVRDVQSYDLHPHLFGKFVKVELHSHYGSEHYCPVSMIRVYGTSEFEVLETEVEAHHATQEIDEDDEEGTLETGDPSDPPRNLFGSARAVVMSIVKKAAEALVKGGETGNATANTTDPEDGDSWDDSDLSCQWSSTPSHLIVCDNCSNTLYHYVWNLLGQKQRELYEFVQVPFVREALMSGPVCAGYGLDFGRRRPLNYPSRPDPGDYLKSLLPDSYVVALCNALAVIEKKVMLNASRESNNTVVANITDYNEVLLNTEYEGLLLPPVATCSVDTSVSSEPCKPPAISEDAPNLSTSSPHSDSSSAEDIASQIKPTKTLTEAEVNDRLFASTHLPDAPPPQDVSPPEVLPVDSTVPSVDHNTTVDEGNANVTQTTDQVEEPTDSAETFPSEEDPALDTLLSDLKDLDPTLDVTYPPVLTTTTLPPQKESVFVRITNRIKALERNMSLSSQYLEELSRRYKKQVEEISRTLNRTLAVAEAEAKRRDELEKKSGEELSALREEIATLTSAVNTLLVDKDSWYNKAMVVCQHMGLVVVEVMFFVGALCLCRRLPVWEGRERKWSLRWGREQEATGVEKTRRKSMEAVPGQRSPKARRKRPSEVALNIAGTYTYTYTYTDLLITEPQPATAPKAETKRRRRRKKEGGLPKSSSSASLQQKNSRKTSTNSSSGGGSGPSGAGDIRRASLSELGGSFWLPVNEDEGVWMRGQEESLSVNAVGGPTQSSCDTLRLGLEPCVIEVPENPRTIEVLGDSLPVLQEMNGPTECENLPKYRSLSSVAPPAFMRTAVASRADRRASETVAQARLKSDNWEFWHAGRQSSQTSLVPTAAVNGNEDSSDKGSEGGGTQERKKARGFKKMVKRFF